MARHRQALATGGSAFHLIGKTVKTALILALACGYGLTADRTDAHQAADAGHFGMMIAAPARCVACDYNGSVKDFEG
jgi:hypothetical protein